MQAAGFHRTTAIALWTALALALGGCGSLLPRGTADTPVGFENFADAEIAVKRVEGLKTPVSELKALGFDPAAGPNVTLIPYPDIVARLAPYPGVPVDQLDPGIRLCIEAQSACRGYLFHFEHQSRKREGSFWLDFLNVRRHTQVMGWWFDALIVTADGIVLFRNYGGQASTDKLEKQVNPLGPLQPAGESAGQLFR
jgi:hypothetical protein